MSLIFYPWQTPPSVHHRVPSSIPTGQQDGRSGLHSSWDALMVKCSYLWWQLHPVPDLPREANRFSWCRLCLSEYFTLCWLVMLLMMSSFTTQYEVYEDVNCNNRSKPVKMIQKTCYGCLKFILECNTHDGDGSLPTLIPRRHLLAIITSCKPLEMLMLHMNLWRIQIWVQHLMWLTLQPWVQL